MKINVQPIVFKEEKKGVPTCVPTLKYVGLVWDTALINVN